ncbi:MAG: ribosome-binding factor A [Legionellales bacterium RIFCSPHIGHO2_12_FULL_42_9]|nr:MAG: ribosome-binding factor A [Legionellales bacterium RIFCSPHIGHO2_12_FULL_42_9]
MKIVSKRCQRVATLLQQQLSELIQHETADPRLPQFVTISEIVLSPDLHHAKVYFTLLKGDSNQASIILNHMAGYLRNILAKTSKLRTVPNLIFVFDESTIYARNLCNLINQANKE